MKDPWINRIFFWMLAFVPLVWIVTSIDIYGDFFFTAFMLIYALIYRPILHIVRLLNLKKIEEKDAWKFFVPFYSTRFMRSLWLG